MCSSDLFLVYNVLENVWEPLYDNDANAVIEYYIAPGKPALVDPKTSIGLDRFKIKKVTSGVTKTQTGSASSFMVTTVRILF